MSWCCKTVSCLLKKQTLIFSFRQRKGHKQNQGLQLKAQYDNSLTLDTPLLTRKMVLYIVYFFTFWQLLYDLNKDCKQMVPVLTFLLWQVLASAPGCPRGLQVSALAHCWACAPFSFSISTHICLLRQEQRAGLARQEWLLQGRRALREIHCSLVQESDLFSFWSLITAGAVFCSFKAEPEVGSGGASLSFKQPKDSGEG